MYISFLLQHPKNSSSSKKRRMHSNNDEDDDSTHSGDIKMMASKESNSNIKINKTSNDSNDDIEHDLYNLTACSYHPINSALLIENDVETVLKLEGERLAQSLFSRLMDLPMEVSDHGPVYVLPNEVFVLPKSQREPEPKPETKWEKFAKEKGIKKRKRDRMVFDEEDQQYKPRFGYKGINSGIEDMPIVEVKAGQDPFADPWADARKGKKDAIKKNMKNQMRNQNKAMGRKPAVTAAAYDPESVPGIPVDLDGPAAKRGKVGVRKALQLVQHSTASMGRYDDMRKGEPERKIQGKKKLFRDNSAPVTSEKANMKAQLRIVADKADKKARGVTNSLASYEGILPDAPAGSFKQKKGKGKAPAGEGEGFAKSKAKTGRGKGQSIERRIQGKGKKGKK